MLVSFIHFPFINRNKKNNQQMPNNPKLNLSVNDSFEYIKKRETETIAPKAPVQIPTPAVISYSTEKKEVLSIESLLNRKLTHTENELYDKHNMDKFFYDSNGEIHKYVESYFESHKSVDSRIPQAYNFTNNIISRLAYILENYPMFSDTLAISMVMRDYSPEKIEQCYSLLKGIAKPKYFEEMSACALIDKKAPIADVCKWMSDEKDENDKLISGLKRPLTINEAALFVNSNTIDEDVRFAEFLIDEIKMDAKTIHTNFNELTNVSNEYNMFLLAELVEKGEASGDPQDVYGLTYVGDIYHLIDLVTNNNASQNHLNRPLTIAEAVYMLNSRFNEPNDVNKFSSMIDEENIEPLEAAFMLNLNNRK